MSCDTLYTVRRLGQSEDVRERPRVQVETAIKSLYAKPLNILQEEEKWEKHKLHKRRFLAEVFSKPPAPPLRWQQQVG